MAARPARRRCQPAARSARSRIPAAARIQPARLPRSCAAAASGIASSCCLSAEGPYRSSSRGGSWQASGGDASTESATARSAAAVRERLAVASVVSVCDAQRRRISSDGLGLSPACSLSPQVSSCATESEPWSLPFDTSAGGESPYGIASSAMRRTEAHRAHGLDASSASSPTRWRTERCSLRGEGGILAEWRSPCSVWGEGAATSSCRRFVAASMVMWSES